MSLSGHKRRPFSTYPSLKKYLTDLVSGGVGKHSIGGRGSGSCELRRRDVGWHASRMAIPAATPATFAEPEGPGTATSWWTEFMIMETNSPTYWKKHTIILCLFHNILV